MFSLILTNTQPAVVVMVMNGLHSLFRRRAISGHQQRGSLGDSDVVVGDAEGREEAMHGPRYPLHRLLIAVGLQ